MKLLHINSYYFESKFYKHLYDNQETQNLDISVYVPTTGNSYDDFNYGLYTLLSKNHTKYDRFIFLLKHNKILSDIKRNYNVNDFDILHAHSLFSNGFIAFKLNIEYKIPYIAAVRNTDINVFFKWMIHLRKLGIEILKNASNIIFLSESYRDIMIKKYIPDYLKSEILNKSIVLPNGIDEFWLKNKNSSKLLFKKEGINIIYAGAIDKNKNLITAVKAINILMQKGYNVKYTAVGKIIDKSIFENITKYPFVKYISQQPKEELIKLYRENDIFLMPSITETFGLVYAEAMSQGLPIIYSEGQGFDRQFDEGVVGYHVDCFNAEEIANRILDILINYQKIYNNCIILCKKFDWETIAQKYKNIYEDIILN